MVYLDGIGEFFVKKFLSDYKYKSHAQLNKVLPSGANDSKHMFF